jgi:phage gp29-like protein
MKIFGLTFGATPQNKTVDKGTNHKKKVGDQAESKRQIYETEGDLLKLRNARDQANATDSYNREYLHEIYRQVIKDTHLQSQWNTRKMKTKQREFEIVGSNDEKNDQLTDLLKTGWFYEFIDFVLDAKLWGFSLVQFGVWRNGTFNDFQLNGEIKERVYSIDRDYVKPEFGIVSETPSDTTGASYLENKIWTIFAGGNHDLGLLNKLSQIMLIKDNAIKNWSEWAEVFGMDVKYVKTDKQNTDRQSVLTAVKNLGSNGVGVFSPEDELIFAGTSRSDAYKVYNELIRYADEQISKILFGQDVVSNNTGQVVGKTGENVAKMYGNADAIDIKAIVNDELLPFLTRIGAANFAGYKFDFVEKEELTIAERAEIDLKISQMGKQHSDEYINETYGTDVEGMSDNTADVAKEIKNLYS